MELKPRESSLADYFVETPNFFSGFVLSFIYLLATPILIEISNSINSNPADLNLIFSFSTAGSIIGQLTSFIYHKKFKKLHILLGAYILLIPVMFLISISRTLFLFYLFYFLTGYITGIIWVLANTNIFESRIANKDRLATITLSFSAIGGITSPLIVTMFMQFKINWRITYLISIIIILAVVLMYLTIPRKRKDENLNSRGEDINFREIFNVKKNNVLFSIIIAIIITFVIAETIITTWTPTFLRLERLFDIQSAGYIYTVFMISILAGRLIVTYFAGKIKTNLFLIILLSISLISVAALIFSTSRIIIFLSSATAGLGISGIFPLLLSSGRKVFKKGLGMTLSLLTTADYIGLSIAPFLVKFLSKYSLILSISLAIVFLSIAIILLIIKMKFLKNEPEIIS